MRASNTGRASTILLAVTLLAVTLTVSFAAFGREALTLRVNDAIGKPGGLVAVVIRTYASRPVGQGQICIGTGGARARSAGAALVTPFAELVDVLVLASRRDGVSSASLERRGGGQEILLQFSSESGSINRTDGPLAVLYFRLRDNLRPGMTFQISIDPAQTRLFDAAGNVIPTQPRAGELTVRAASDPFAVEAEGDKIAPGQVAELGIETFEPFAIANGRIALLYDAGIQAGRAKVRMSRKYGSRRFRVDRSTPGLLLITFKSPRKDLNLVPGELISVRVPTRSAIARGTRSAVEIDPALSFFVGPAGNNLPLEFEGKNVRFTRDDDGDDGDRGDDDSGGGGDDDDNSGSGSDDGDGSDDDNSGSGSDDDDGSDDDNSGSGSDDDDSGGGGDSDDDDDSGGGSDDG